jgi:hypothetical protein
LLLLLLLEAVCHACRSCKAILWCGEADSSLNNCIASCGICVWALVGKEAPQVCCIAACVTHSVALLLLLLLLLLGAGAACCACVSCRCLMMLNGSWCGCEAVAAALVLLLLLVIRAVMCCTL